MSPSFPLQRPLLSDHLSLTSCPLLRPPPFPSLWPISPAATVPSLRVVPRTATVSFPTGSFSFPHQTVPSGLFRRPGLIISQRPVSRTDTDVFPAAYYYERYRYLARGLFLRPQSMPVQPLDFHHPLRQLQPVPLWSAGCQSKTCCVRFPSLMLARMDGHSSQWAS